MREYWLVRPKPHNILRIHEFLSQNIIAIGWPALGDLTHLSRENLKDRLKQPPYALDSYAWGQAYATVDIFVNQMKLGDLVLIPNGDDIYFGRIAGDYHFDPAKADESNGYPHQRSVEWLSNCGRSALSLDLRSSLKAPRTIAQLSNHADEIEALSRGERCETTTSNSVQTLPVSYPLRPDFSVSFEIPKDITKEEAQRLSTYFASLYFN